MRRGKNSASGPAISNTTVANVITGAGSVSKLGANTITLTGVNTYTGATTISGGTLALSQLAQHGDEALRVLGFIDEDPRRAGTRIGGYPVLGNFSALSLLVSTRSVDLVIIASPQVSAERLHNLQALCRENAVSLTRIHVALEEIISEESSRPAPPSTVVPFSSRS